MNIQTRSQYSKVAKLAYENVISKNMTFHDAWLSAANKLLTSNASINKGCPRSTFFGLCESGDLIGIVKTKSNKSLNYKYVKFAIGKWKFDQTISKTEMWSLINNNFQKHNSHQGQLDVLLGVWDNLL